MQHRPLKWNIGWPVLIAALVIYSIFAVFLIQNSRQMFLSQAQKDLQARARLTITSLKPLIQKQNWQGLRSQVKDLSARSGTRLTIINSKGEVLAESARPLQEMDNHGDRPEFKKAISTGQGKAIRYSYTLREQLIYSAIALNGVVIRASRPLQDVLAPLGRTMTIVSLGGLMILGFIGLTLWWRSQRVSETLSEIQTQAYQVAKGDLSARVRLRLSDTLEVHNLGRALNDIVRQMEGRIQTIIRQKNEQSAVLASMSEGVVAIGLDGKVQQINQAAAEMLGLQISEVRGMSLPAVIRNPELQKAIEGSMDSGKEEKREIHFLAEDKEKFFDVNIQPLRALKGERQGVVAVLKDRTQLRQLENYRRDFVANVSHELRTPLTSIQGFSETLLNSDSMEAGQQRKFLETIHKHAKRVNAIVADLLALARLERKSEPIERVKQSVKPILQSALEICEVEAKEKNVKLSLKMPEGDFKATVNAPLLELAVANLVDNSIKYSESGSEILVQGWLENGKPKISVTDSGVGISQENIPRVFERFYRVDQARSRKLGGTGLGLSIVKHIALAHEGEVEAESQLGVGSKFTITLS